MGLTKSLTATLNATAAAGTVAALMVLNPHPARTDIVIPLPNNLFGNQNEIICQGNLGTASLRHITTAQTFTGDTSVKNLQDITQLIITDKDGNKLFTLHNESQMSILHENRSTLLEEQVAQNQKIQADFCEHDIIPTPFTMKTVHEVNITGTHLKQITCKTTSNSPVMDITINSAGTTITRDGKPFTFAPTSGGKAQEEAIIQSCKAGWLAPA